jgi:hypothetical protein
MRAECARSWRRVRGVRRHFDGAPVACPNVVAGERTRCVVQVTFAGKGEWRLQAAHPADSTHLKTVSGFRQLTVK